MNRKDILEEMFNDGYNAGVCDMLDALDSAQEMLIDILSEECCTMTEIVMARHILDRFVDLFDELAFCDDEDANLDCLECDEYDCLHHPCADLEY